MSHRSAARPAVRLLALGLVALTTAAAIAYQPPSDRPSRGPGNQPGQRGPGGGQPGERGPGEQPGERGPGGRTMSVEAGMRQMNGALRRLSGQITDAGKKDENLRLIGDAQRGCLGAKGAQLPANVLEGKDPATRDKALAEFRSDLIRVMRLFLDAEQAIMAGDGAAAKAKIDEAEKIKDAGHQRLGV